MGLCRQGAVHRRLGQRGLAHDVWHRLTGLPQFPHLLNLLWDQKGLATKSCSPLSRFLDPIHLPFTANVVLELGDQGQDAHDELSGA